MQRWREEVDRIALWGINAPLLPIGLEAAEAAVYSSMGLTEAELTAWFTGHSHLPWQRMANIQSIAGPLPTGSWAQQSQLGAAVSGMMTELGMTPVLNGFAGHVPNSLARIQPQANITRSSDWGGVGCNYSCDALLEPTDPLFPTLAAALNAKVLELYGQGVQEPMFNADTFNEEGPESGDVGYLAQWNKVIYSAMVAAHPDSIYVMQAWAFHSDFWTVERVQAYLSPVPLTKFLILDLNTESGPVWQKYNGFFGHDWAWCGLIVFGGRRGVYGNLPVLATSMYTAREASSSLTGLGITPEAIDQCGTAFDMVLESGWRAQPIDDVGGWLRGWAARRYSLSPTLPTPNLVAAYTLLESAVFKAGGPDLSVYEKTPTLSSAMSGGTNATGVLSAARLMVAAYQSGEIPLNSTTFSYDLTDLIRQAASALHSDMVGLFAARFKAPPSNATTNNATLITAALGALGNASTAFLMDLDAFLSLDPNFLLGQFTEAARALGGVSDGEAGEQLFVRDAKLLVSLWTEDGLAFGGQINDYSSRGGWAGLISSYYAQKWALFHATYASTYPNQPPGGELDTELRALAQAWVNDTGKVFPTNPSSNPASPGLAPAAMVAGAVAFLAKWFPLPSSSSPPSNPPTLPGYATACENMELVAGGGPPGPPPPPAPHNWVFLGSDTAAVGEDCPFLSEPKLTSLADCEAGCLDSYNHGGGCNFVNWDAVSVWCVYRGCEDPLHAQLSPNPGYSAYALNVTGKASGQVKVQALLKDPGALSSVCASDPLCTAFDTSGLVVEGGGWALSPKSGTTTFFKGVAQCSSTSGGGSTSTSTSNSVAAGASAAASPPAVAALSSSAMVVGLKAACRDPHTWPFSTESVWNTPLGKGAHFSPASLFPNGVVPKNGVFSDDDYFLTTTPDSPTIPWYSQGHWNATPDCLQFPWSPYVRDVPWPSANYTITAGGNNALALLLPDDDTLILTQPAYRCNDSAPLLSLLDRSQFGTGSLRGVGNWGGHGGSALNAIGGSLRVGELLPTSPTPPTHTLKLQLWAAQYYYGVAHGANKTTCYRWPALVCDGYSEDPTLYGGSNPLLTPGALLAIPANTLPTLLASLTTQPAMALAWTLANYGGLLCDDTYADRMTFNTEHGFSDAFHAAWGFPFVTWEGDSRAGAGAWLQDVLTLFKALWIVDNNSKETPGGGGAPLQPPPPPFCT